ncbi:MAG: coproporphyrinogen III oxidase [Bacteroidetes bacterium HGW-Bacteroidetes-1]|jgi:oxygen-independent coproporphyrinogen-3 oxidase|nr:MAG: coproporphyrinogen III oxidase [Bacteroidetes bacterium HGW-Bacteroidetes-1]
MAGIYIHIPFCKQKCHYCNFFSLASNKYRDEFVKALLQEMEMKSDYLKGEEVRTVYIGGGTPSMLEVSDIHLISEKLNTLFSISKDAEITLEANPDDISKVYLKALKSTFVNRLSIGIQSFFADDLHYLHRVHDEVQSRKAIEEARDAGFDKFTIDLIYGIPTLTNEKWLKNLEYFFATGINHLSAYALTVEPRTSLSHLISKGRMPAVDEMQSAQHFEMLIEKMEEKGFIHYEISNFARPGHYSKHNSIYWLGGNYLGLGPSAHSYNGVSRQWNVSNLAKYIQNAALEGSVAEKEVLTMEQLYNEYVMTSLRTSWGCDLEHIRNGFGLFFLEHCIKESNRFIELQELRLDNNRLYLTNKGKLFADGIASAMFMDS